MNEEIKDPNQLDLFAGILFTPEQEKLIAEFLEREKSNLEFQVKTNQQNEQLLVDYGFIKNVNFVNTFKVETITREVTLGRSWDKNVFTAELTYQSCSGGISLKGKKHSQGKLTDTTFWIDFQKGKVQANSIQDHYRFIKPSTLLEKLKAYNEREENRLEYYKKQTNLKQTVVDKYTELYPNAKVKVRDEWTRYDGSFEVVEVEFESGSYIWFRLDIHNNKEYIYKKYDAEFAKLSLDELLERFSKQVKKEASN